jgi:hypothetical protein
MAAIPVVHGREKFYTESGYWAVADLSHYWNFLANLRVVNTTSTTLTGSLVFEGY